MDVTKPQLRERWKTLRPSVAAAREASAVIATTLLPLVTRGTVMVFAAMPGEPDVSDAARAWLAAGVRVCVPRVLWSTRGMEACAVSAWDTQITRDARGVPGPIDTCGVIEPTEIQAVLVPGVAFDVRGVRLGRGAGFYDRFLSQPGMTARKVGVCFESQMVPWVPGESHDVAMDEIVTEKSHLVCAHG